MRRAKSTPAALTVFDTSPILGSDSEEAKDSKGLDEFKGSPTTVSTMYNFASHTTSCCEGTYTEGKIAFMLTGAGTRFIPFTKFLRVASFSDITA